MAVVTGVCGNFYLSSSYPFDLLVRFLVYSGSSFVETAWPTVKVLDLKSRGAFH